MICPLPLEITVNTVGSKVSLTHLCTDALIVVLLVAYNLISHLCSAIKVSKSCQTSVALQ